MKRRRILLLLFFLLLAGFFIIEMGIPYVKNLLVISAIAEKDVDALSRALDRGGSANTLFKRKYRPIHLAIQINQDNRLEMIRLLAKHGADLNARDDQEDTPLHLAARMGCYRAILLLAELGADLEALDKEGDTSFVIAMRCQYEKSALALLKSGAKWLSSYPAFHEAATQGSLVLLQSMVELGADVDMYVPVETAQRVREKAIATGSSIGYVQNQEILEVSIEDIRQHTALQIAAGKGYTDIVRFLIAAGANVNCCSPVFGTPLNQAVEQGHAETTKSLLELGANPNIYGKVIPTPLYAACYFGDCQIADMLTEAGADLISGETYGFPPFLGAILGNQPDIVTFLVEKGVDVNGAFEEEGLTPLSHACTLSSTDVFDTLLLLGANPTSISGTGSQPVHVASIWQSNDCLQRLIELDVDVNVPDVRGRTPLHYSAMCGNETGIKCLLSAGAKSDIQDIDDMTPADLAEVNGHLDLASLLRQ